MPIRDLAKYAFGAVLALALMGWVLRGTDPSTLWAEIRQASLPGLLLGAALNLVQNVFRVWRWQVLLAPVRRGLSFRGMFAAIVVGYMISWVVPGRLGELVRPMLVSAREGIALGPTVGSVVADRVLDLVSVALLFAIGIWVTPLSGKAAEHADLLRTGSVLATLVGIGLLAAMVATSMAGEKLGAWFSRRGRTLRWLGRAAVGLSHGAGALRSPRLIIAVTFWSVLVWVTIAAATWTSIRATGVPISFGAILVVMPMLVLGIAVPTPGGAGSYHGAMKAGLMLFGVSSVSAVSAGLLTHVMMTVPVILAGLVLLWTEKMRWHDLVAAARKFRELGDESATRLEGVS